MEEESLKPGQKHPTPTPGNGDRVFYETLYRQRPDSEMAQEWCVLPATSLFDYRIALLWMSIVVIVRCLKLYFVMLMSPAVVSAAGIIANSFIEPSHACTNPILYNTPSFILQHNIRCIAYGVLSEEEASKVYKLIVKRKGSKKTSSSSPAKPSSSAGAKKKKSKIVMDDVEYDAGMGAGGDEGIGVTAM